MAKIKIRHNKFTSNGERSKVRKLRKKHNGKQKHLITGDDKK